MFLLPRPYFKVAGAPAFDPEAGLTITRTLSANATHSANNFGRGHNQIVQAIDFTGLDGSAGGMIFEFGGSGKGAYVGFRADGTFIARGGGGGNPWQSTTSRIELAGGDSVITGTGTLVVEWDDANSGSVILVRAWWNGVQVGAASTTLSFSNSDIAGNNDGGVLVVGGGGTTSGEVSTAVAYTTSSGLRIYENQLVT